MNELISIVVPVYNTEKYLEKCLKSLIEQTYSNFEIICVNDNSTDDSLKIVDKYMKKNDKIKIINKNKNEGVIKARLDAYRICKGEYICNVDSDDFLEKDSIEKSYKFLKKENLDISLFDSYYFWSNKNLKKINKLENGTILNGVEAFIKTLNWEIAALGIYRKKIIFQNLDENYFNGDELATRKRMLNSKKIGLSEGKYFYRQHEFSLTKSNKLTVNKFEILLTNIELKKLIKEKVSKFSNKFESQYLSNLINFLELYLININNFSEDEKEKIRNVVNKSVEELDLNLVKKYYLYKLNLIKYLKYKNKLRKLLKIFKG